MNMKLISKNTKLHKQFKYFITNHDDLVKILQDKLDENPHEIDVSDINTSKMTDLSNVFWDLDGIKELKVIRGLEYWDVSNVKYFNSCFRGCESVQDFSGVENWDVSNGKTFESMFRDTHALDYLDLSKWNSRSCTIVTGMFKWSGISALDGLDKLLDIARKWAPKRPIKEIALGSPLDN